MNLRIVIRKLQVQSDNSKRVLSKLLENPKFWSKSGENGFIGGGWRGGGQLIWKEFLAKQRYHFEGLKGFKSSTPQFQGQSIRTLRSASGKTGDKAKGQPNTILTSLQDRGASMSGITHVFIKPAVFTALITSGSFIGSTIWQYENQRGKLQRNGSFNFSSIGGGRSRTSTQEQDKRFEFRNAIRLWWEKATPADKIFWPICAINCLVFAAWHMPGLAPRMVTYFTATPISRSICWPMLLSTFSHYSLFHLGANMFVLHSFLPAATSLLGPEQFVGTYLSAGVISSFGSHLYKLLIGSNVPSLGASGAVMGILAYVCMKMPDIELGIIFVPGLTFSADTAIKCILAVDSVGLIAGWKIMDHAAHLSGAVYGIALCYFETSVLASRDKIMRFWHSLRRA